MESNLSFFSLPFVDHADLDFRKNHECGYEDLHPTLPSHGSLLGADEVLAQFLSGDEPLEEPDLNGPTTLHCEICRKQFDNAKKYYGHLRVHSKDNLWICDKCPNEKFSTKQQLMKHSLTHKPLERVWHCPQCDMSFEALWRLQQHLFAKHLDYRPHKCDRCEMSFHKLSDLKKHKDIHDDIKNHACKQCKMRFRDISNLKRHMLRHGSEKPYPCPGCGNRYTQLASMQRHSKKCAAIIKKEYEPVDKTIRKNYCRVCGMTFQYKSALLEHCVRQHSNNPPQPTKEPPKEDKSNQLHLDTTRTVDKIVDDILSAEDDYLIQDSMPTQNEMLNVYPPIQPENPDNLMQIELLKEMNQMHILDDELLYNDIDFDSFQTMCNTNDMDYTDRNLLFDITDGRSIDQDIMNALYHVKGEHLPDEFLNAPEILNTEKVNDYLNPAVSVNECATIFESDVDLEASTNLAANLNQLIGENSVQYISTEHDDTFIISLNSEIDAEQLTDMLNIGMEENRSAEKEDTSNNVTNLKAFVVKSNNVVAKVDNEPAPENSIEQVTEPIVVKIERLKRDNENNSEVKENETVKKNSMKKRVLYICRKCNKVFSKKDNYKSHRATHEPTLRHHKCRVCGERFSYKSTLNKHVKKHHTPLVKTTFECSQCDKSYDAAWMVTRHMERDHDLQQPYECDEYGCGKKFYKKFDLDVHKRFHTGERPYKCDICNRGFHSVSHLRRHVRKVDCTKYAKKRVPV